MYVSSPDGGTSTTHLILLLGCTAMTEVRFTQPHVNSCVLAPKYLPQHPIEDLLFNLCCSVNLNQVFVCFWHDSPLQWAMATSLTRFLDHTQRHTTVGRIPLDERSARRRDLYLTTHTALTTDKYPCPPVGIEPTISAGERS